MPSAEYFLKFNPSGEVIVAWFIIGILILLSFIVFLKARKADPLKRPKGILLLVEWAIEKLDGFVGRTMGPGFENFGGYFLGVIPFLFLSFTSGILGLPTAMSSLCVPLTLALTSFLLIHKTSAKYTKWKYFKRYIDPFPIFLPINLLSMWAPLLSWTLRLFGNAVVGFVLMSILDWGLGSLGAAIFGVLPGISYNYAFVPFVTPVLHAYFDMFSGFIQSLVFVYLSALLIAQERPEDAPIDEVAIAGMQRKEEVKV